MQITSITSITSITPTATPAELLIATLASFEPSSVAVALRESLCAGGDPSLAERLLASAGEDEERRAALADFIGHAASTLAPDDLPPSNGAASEAWVALVAAADALNGSGAH
ncbi:MAG: hypothetical protein ACREPM_08185, partial [Gemmatimonadaceae bacterium]